MTRSSHTRGGADAVLIVHLLLVMLIAVGQQVWIWKQKCQESGGKERLALEAEAARQLDVVRRR